MEVNIMGNKGIITYYKRGNIPRKLHKKIKKAIKKQWVITKQEKNI